MKIEILINQERCKGCGICVEVCQLGVLAMIEQPGLNIKQIPRVEKIEDCVGCGICEMHCPDFAISIIRKLEAAKIG